MSAILEAVKTADNRHVTVTVVNGTHQHGECCYTPGQSFTVPYHEGKCYLEDETTDSTYDCPFPPYCTDGDIHAKPFSSYRDTVVLAAGIPKEVMVPSGYSCCPVYVSFTGCGGCVWANYGADTVEPALVPSVDILDGTAPDMNPSIRTLQMADGTVINKISVVSNADTTLQLEYFGA